MKPGVTTHPETSMRRRRGEIAHADDAIPPQPHVRPGPRRARSVDHRPVLEHEVERLGHGRTRCAAAQRQGGGEGEQPRGGELCHDTADPLASAPPDGPGALRQHTPAKRSRRTAPAG